THDQREKNPARIFCRQVKRDTQNHCADVFSGCRLKEVSATTCAVTYVVTNEVSDNSRIARIIFRNVGFYFTYKVGTDVGRFRVDTAAKLGKECYKASSKAKTHDQRGNLLD